MIDFWSSVELGTFADELCQELSRLDMPARQRFFVSKRDYWSARSTVQRIGLRAKMYGGYPLQVGLDFLFRSRPPINIVTSNTFFAPWMASRLARNDRHVIHLVYDLYPDVLVAAGRIRAGSIADRALHRLTSSTFERVSANVFLGPRLLQHALQCYGPIPNAVVIPVGASATPFCDAVRESPPDAPVTILYCGNLGCLHDMTTVAAGLSNRRNMVLQQTGRPSDGTGVSPTKLHWRFHVHGSRLNFLRDVLMWQPGTHREMLANGDIVECGAHLEESAWVDLMKSADVALVTMAPGAEHVMMPSKTYSALVAGQAILGICPETSDLGDLIREHDCGWLVKPGDTEGLNRVLTEITTERAVVLQKRKNARQVGHARYAMSVIAGQWGDLVKTVLEKSNGENGHRNP